MYFVYLLECADRSIYTGIATDVQRRFQEHRKGTGAAYTRARKPIRILYTEEVADRSAALRREAAIKKLSREKKLALIAAG
jgi:putative endonuclease